MPIAAAAARVAYGSIVVAIAVMAIKYVAYLRTGSAALYSDALESVVNVVTAVAALIAIRVAGRPADRRHPFGHHKAEFFSSGLEGALILVAAAMILREAWGAWTSPRVIDAPLAGLAINAVATAINAAWSSLLVRSGRAWKSPAMVADGWHLWTDVITSVGVLVALGLATATGWWWLDPVIAAGVALNIVWAGWRIMTQSVGVLMDESVTGDILSRIRSAISSSAEGAIQVHDLRTRSAGRITFVEFHLVVPGDMTVTAAHDICDRIEDALNAAIEGLEILIHVEPEGEAKSRGALTIG